MPTSTILLYYKCYYFIYDYCGYCGCCCCCCDYCNYYNQQASGSGPRTEPWETPTEQGVQLEQWEPNRTVSDRPVRYDWTHMIAEPVKPKLWDNLRRS